MGALLEGEIYGVNELQAGKLYSVESRISVKFKNGRRLDDFVAGAGGKVEEAFLESLQNFCLTTLYPIYAELFDHNDPHLRKEIWTVNGVQRRIFLSGWGQRGRKFAFPALIRWVIIYAISATIESSLAGQREIIGTRRHFPSDNAMPLPR